ncbi:RNA polymerase II transcription factor B subunit 4 [Cyphellophora attinorum]|uniref:General transcription and DNA repair factor IIH subunit TFB4 n=1 Tax=Cyphellophora attinorum TaxID=1664694 RepID=A0A0N1H3M1_9EURO|nr:RNA polymerase II transcription factor B subunit 4 [Phialophora attinorum]KPI35476.1 RNA polymerase II transcription factor B subunit 4 [Phialophora attinorum]
MDGLETNDRSQQTTTEQSPSLLTIILDTNPAAWALLSDTLPLSAVVANILVFINAHLACNFTNKVAVIASQPDKAQWLYPPSQEQQTAAREDAAEDTPRPAKRVKLNSAQPTNSDADFTDGSKYRPFRLIETALLNSLTELLNKTTPTDLDPSSSTSTMIAGALTLALSYINRESIAYSESIVGVATDPTTQQTADTSSPSRLQSRILLISASPTTDLAHQYIPVMNAIFACQRLSIPIDILAIPLPKFSPTNSSDTQSGTPAISSSNSTVFLQQASDATNGIYLPFTFPPTGSSSSSSQQPRIAQTSSALLQLLLSPLLPSPLVRTHLTSPTLINIDFRAACFCHRRVIDLGYVCSVCLSIFCEPPLAEEQPGPSTPTPGEPGGKQQEPAYECFTCGTRLGLGEGVGRKPIVVARRKKKKKVAGARSGLAGGEGNSRVGTPVPG